MRKRLPDPFFPNNFTFGVLSCIIPIVHTHDVSKQIPRGKKNFHLVENVLEA